jgi:hypothetical protein
MNGKYGPTAMIPVGKKVKFLIEPLVVIIFQTLQGCAPLKTFRQLPGIVVSQSIYQTFLKSFGICVEKMPDIGMRSTPVDSNTGLSGRFS